jgi:hypothetical protein
LAIGLVGLVAGSILKVKTKEVPGTVRSAQTPPPPPAPNIEAAYIGTLTDRAAAGSALTLGGVVSCVPNEGGSPIQIYPNLDGGFSITSDDNRLVERVRALEELDQKEFWVRPFILTHVNLWGRKGTTDWILERLHGLRGLKTLNLAYTSVSNEGLDHLRDLTGLTLLRLNDTAVNAAGAGRLQEALPKCKIALEPAIAYSKIAAGSWTPVMNTANDVKAYPDIKFANGIIEFTDRHIVRIPGCRGRDQAIRAKLKKLPGQNMGVGLRFEPDSNFRRHTVYFNGGRIFGMGVSKDRGFVNFGEVLTPQEYPEFFELMFACEGETLAAFVDGRQIMESRDAHPVVGDACFGALGQALFKQIEVQKLK